MNAFIKDILLQAGNVRTDHIMFTFGEDFQYENAMEYYLNIDKLMKYTMEKVHECSVFGMDRAYLISALFRRTKSCEIFLPKEPILSS